MPFTNIKIKKNYMEEKYNEATKNRPEGDRPVEASQLLIDIKKRKSLG